MLIFKKVWKTEEIYKIILERIKNLKFITKCE